MAVNKKYFQVSENCHSYFACKNSRLLPRFAKYWLPSLFLMLVEAEDAQPYADIYASSHKKNLNDAYILKRN